MRKNAVVFLMCVLAAFLIASCDSSSHVARTYEVGDKGPAGGWIFAVNENYEKGSSDATKSWKYLEAAPSDLEKMYAWGPTSPSYGCRNHLGDGKYNMKTFRLMNIDNFPAAKACSEYNGGGYTDWFLPSIDEMSTMYRTLERIQTGIEWEPSYCTSSEWAYDMLYTKSFSTGTEEGVSCKIEKNQPNYVRPVRAFE